MNHASTSDKIDESERIDHDREGAVPMIAVAIVGTQKRTKITYPRPLSAQTLDNFAKVVALRDPGRIYHLVACKGPFLHCIPGPPLYVWHVEDGLDHATGRWTKTKTETETETETEA
jgi:hypothetical protein